MKIDCSSINTIHKIEFLVSFFEFFIVKTSKYYIYIYIFKIISKVRKKRIRFDFSKEIKGRIIKTIYKIKRIT